MKRQAAHLFWSTHPCRAESATRHCTQTCGAVLALILTASTPAVAQYTAPGTAAPTRHTPTKVEFQDKIKAAPWKAGALAIRPWLGLRDFQLVTELDRQGEAGGEDLTFTLGAGLRGYLPAGPKALFAVHALPEYVWWQDRSEKRRLNGRYGLGFFVFFNRLTLELSQRRIEQQSFFSSEIQALTTSRNDISTLSLDLEVTPNISLFGIASLQDSENLEDESATFSILDREDETGLLGVRYENSEGWVLELGYMDTSADFAEGARDLSNSGSAQLASIGLDRSRVGFRLDLTFLNREADAGSEFGMFDETTGNLAVLWRPSKTIDVLGYARRAQSYSTDRRFSYFLEERQGARVNFDFDRVRFGVFGEVGEDDFEDVTAGLPNRIDDVTAYGGDIGITFREVSFSVRATQTDYDSIFDAFDRDVSSVQFRVEFTAISRFTSQLIDKLSLGSAGNNW